MEEAKNKRYILSAQELWFKDIAAVLKNAYPDYNIKDKELGYCPIKFVSFFDKSVKLILPFWNVSFKLENNRSREILGIQYKPGPDAIIAMA